MTENSLLNMYQLAQKEKKSTNTTKPVKVVRSISSIHFMCVSFPDGQHGVMIKTKTPLQRQLDLHEGSLTPYTLSMHIILQHANLRLRLARTVARFGNKLEFFSALQSIQSITLMQTHHRNFASLLSHKPTE